MRPRHGPERQNHICARADGIIKSVGTADYKCNVTVSALDPTLQPVGEGSACQAFAGFIKHNKRSVASCQRIGDERIFTAFFIAGGQSALFAQFQNRQAGNSQLAAGDLYAAAKILNQRHLGRAAHLPDGNNTQLHGLGA